VSIYQKKAKECKCCGKHVPLPTTFKEYNGVTVCPTTFSNILEYKRIWNELGSRPPGNVRKHFSEYVQLMVENSYEKNNI
jgi:hypothetical protein